MTYEAFKLQYNLCLNPQQEAAVKKVDGAVLLLAVPGSGKTTVLVDRLGYMIYGCSIPPENILVMTYTKAATKDMRERYISVYGDKYANQIEFRTINGVASKIIKRFENMTGRKAFSLITDAKIQSKIISDAYKKITDEFATETTIKTILIAIAYIKNMMLTDDQIKSIDFGDESVFDIYKIYAEALTARHLMDYDDQLVFARKMLMSNQALLSELHRKYRYICVDEAQDTSKIQHKLIRLLALPQGNLFMVGDEDQSIYGFRAAYPEALLEFEKQYSGATVLKMEQNYRSCPQIIKVADDFIQKNTKRHKKHIIKTRNINGFVRDIPTFDRYSQYKYLKSVAKKCEQETAVLYRDNDSAIPLIDLLSREGISYKTKQLDSLFFTSHPVQDITDLIKLSISPSDSEAFLRIFYKLNLYINKTAAISAVEYDRNNHCGILKALLQLNVLNPKSRADCKSLCTHLSKLLEEPADKAVFRLAHYTGYSDYLDEHRSFICRITILEMLGKNEENVQGLLRRLDELRSLISSDTQNEDSNFTLSTIHSSKGLEYNCVFLCDVIDGILPSCSAPAKGADDSEISAYEEERRLFYVAMTRAKDNLAIFSFNKDELKTSFSDEVFQKRKMTSPKEAIPLENTSQIHSPNKYSEEQIRIMSSEYGSGVPVVHKAFGEGVVVDVNGDIISISFPKIGTKVFSLSIMLRTNLIKLQ